MGFSIVLLLSIIDSVSNYLLSVKVERNIEFLNRSQEIIRNSATLHRKFLDMQSSFRGYLLTQDTGFLDGYNAGLREMPTLFIQQKNLIESNPQQLHLLGSIESLHKKWIIYTGGLIDSRQNMATSATSKALYDSLFETQLKTQTGRRINDQITMKLSEFDKTEYQARNIHSTNLIASIRRTHIYSLTFFGLTVIIGIVTTAYIVSLISKRIKTMVQLADSISKGEFRRIHDPEKDELTSLSISLNIMSDNLRRNISELKKRNTELDQFAYVVSHDLKAPVRGIHNVMKWIDEDLGNELSAQMKNYLAIIPQRTKRMEDLINGLLDYARIRKKTEPEQTDAREMVEQIVGDIVPRHFDVEIRNLPVLFTEKIKLEQVFTNLISNAVKFTPGENAKIAISCQEFPGHYVFSIKDNGNGIDKQYHTRIFEMFQTLREKDEKESTGIGLSIIKKILDEQHGTIDVVSTLGQGAEFKFTWPKLNSSQNAKENYSIS